MSQLGTIARAPFLAAIALYRVTLSPLIGANCRHLPTCSDYAREAIETNGAWKGGWLTLARLCRCHPWGSHGFDPAPDLIDLGEIAGLRVQPACMRAGIPRQRVQPVLSARAHGNPRTGGKKIQRDRATNALASAGDGDAVAGEVEGRLSSHATFPCNASAGMRP